MKNKKTIIIFAIMLITVGVSSCNSATWKKKQFETEDALINAFKGVYYDDVVKEFGEPYYKRINLHNTMTGESYCSCRWKGVGVKGRADATLVFTTTGSEPNEFYALGSD